MRIFFEGYMDTKEVIAELKGVGYTVEFAPGDKVKLSWQGQGLPDKARVLPLVEYLKSHKAEALDLLTLEATPGHPIPPETLEAIFQECLDDLNRRTTQGLLGEADPNMLARVQEAQARADRVWKECLEGKATLESFSQVVKAWHTAVIALFTSPQAQGPLSRGRLLNP